MKLTSRNSINVYSTSRSSLAAIVFMTTGCAALIPRGLTSTSRAPEAMASTAIPCTAPIPAAPTYVPPPVTTDSAAAYTAAVSSAAVDDALANSKAMSDYQQCLLKH